MTPAPSAEYTRAWATVLRAVRRWFDDHGYLEAITPVLVPSPAMEEHLYPVAAGDGWLRTSPEFALKRRMATGIGRLYEIGPCVRGREHGAWHDREFTMCEWYRAGAELGDLMDEVEALVGAASAALGVPAPAWQRSTVREVFVRSTGLDPAHANAVQLSGIEEPWDDAFLRRWITDVEPSLEGGWFVADWPASQAALARVLQRGDWPTAARFEAYLGGVELANAFLELTDSTEQRHRFRQANAARVAAGEAPHTVDESLIEAVGRMPRTAGIALGVDRLVSVLAGWGGIRPHATTRIPSPNA